RGPQHVTGPPLTLKSDRGPHLSSVDGRARSGSLRPRKFETRAPERRSRPLWAVVSDLLSGGRYLPLPSPGRSRARGDARRTLLVGRRRRLREAVGWSSPPARPADQVPLTPLAWRARDVVPLVVRLVRELARLQLA